MGLGGDLGVGGFVSAQVDDTGRNPSDSDPTTRCFMATRIAHPSRCLLIRHMDVAPAGAPKQEHQDGFPASIRPFLLRAWEVG